MCFDRCRLASAGGMEGWGGVCKVFGDGIGMHMYSWHFSIVEGVNNRTRQAGWTGAESHAANHPRRF